jgi:hypothetical protein
MRPIGHRTGGQMCADPASRPVRKRTRRLASMSNSSGNGDPQHGTRFDTLAGAHPLGTPWIRVAAHWYAESALQRESDGAPQHFWTDGNG